MLPPFLPITIQRWKRTITVIGIVLMIAALTTWRYWKPLINTVKNRYFAYLGDKGPLYIAERGRWRSLRPGLDRRTWVCRRKYHWAKLQLRAVRLDPTQMSLQVWYGKPRRIGWVMRHTKALAAINGGLFAPGYRPLGLFKIRGRLLNRYLHKRSFDGVLYRKRESWGIAMGRGFRHKDIDTAFQSAPLLVRHGRRHAIPRRKSWKVERRSAVCLDPQGRLILLATHGFFNGLSYNELALLLSKPRGQGGVGCAWGLNLDGGTSTQFAIREGDRVYMTRGIDPVPMYLLVRAKSSAK